MEILQWCKMQVMCLLILIYVGIMAIKEDANQKKITKKLNCNKFFDLMFVVAEIAVLFDGITACTVNFISQVPDFVNRLLHLGMFVGYEIFISLLFLYWLSVTVGIPKRKLLKAICILPSIIAILLTVFFIPELQFLKGKYTNYSMGISVYVCFITVAVYFLFTVGAIILKHRCIQEKKKRSLFTTLIFIAIVMLIQIIFPESLVSCIAAAMVLISIYLNMENPTIHGLEYYHSEMVMGFATLVENKDDNTGGHIMRSSAYANLIAENLRKNKKYKNLITRDYLNNLKKSAPMHDVGKIGIPDAILQKKGKLTDEEYEVIKGHVEASIGIIRHLPSLDYVIPAVIGHHERYDGKGYPRRIAGEDIPLTARILCVADSFDAMTSRRCYKAGMPLERVLKILREEEGHQFDPKLARTFEELIENGTIRVVKESGV